jgi:DNA-binding SARP family transcriptional activator/ABC-type transport system substrate-binding protein/DNA-binding beta-propeller fold protein YncE
MQFRLLGPVEVEDGGRPLVLGSAKQRALLAILLLHANEVVSRDRLIDELWGEQPPASAPHSLEVYVSRLRKTLQPDGGERLLLTQAGGYLLRLEPDQLDVTRFERLLAEGRRALDARNYERASERLAEALALWRGSALGDLAYEPFARPEVERLEEQRLATLEERIEAELALSRHASLVAELESLSNKHPLRERLHGQLMLALYRCGRQAEALETYKELRQHLRDELGLDPSPALQRLEQAILRQDPALELAAEVPAGEDGRPAVEPTSPTRRLSSIHQWRPALVAVGIAGLLVAAAAGAVALLTRGSESSLGGVAANAIGIVDPDNGHITGEVLLKGAPSDVTAGGGSIWAVSPNRKTVTRIESGTEHAVDTIDVGNGPSGIAYAGRWVWVVNSLDGTVSRIDPGVSREVDPIPVGNVPVAIAAGFGSVWVTTAGDRSVVRLDAHSGRKLATIPTGDVGRGITVGGGAVWVSDDERGRVSRIDPNTKEVTHIPVGNGAGAVAYVAEELWVANELTGTIVGIDPRTNTIADTMTVGGTPDDVVAANGELWFADASGGRIARVDLLRNEVARTIKTGNRPQGFALAGGRLWLAVQPGASQHRGGTLKVASVGRTFDSLDPALGSDGPALNVLGMHHNGLTAFQRVGNADGMKLVPDLAISLPAPSDDRRTYVFQLRRGIHYSNGQLVRPRDFRYGLERLFSLHSSAGIFYYQSIRGAKRCLQQPKHCDLSAGIATDDRINTVTFNLAAPDPEFLVKLSLTFASPAPAGTPKRQTIVPTTGPYYVATYKVKPKSHKYEWQLELARNPYFREWSKAATPDGYPDRIKWTFLPDRAASYREEVRAVEQGRYDIAFDGVPSGLRHEVRTQYATQVHVDPLWGVTYLYLNPRMAPFSDLRVRRAVNYAANRWAAVPASAQHLGSAPTCQILPPNFPGFHRYCPYTLHPSRTGFWIGPDLRQARRLVAASGTKGTSLALWIPGNQKSEGPIAAALLRSIGYRPHIVDVDPFVLSKAMANPRSHVQASVTSWFADYTAASNFIDTFVCDGMHVCDRRIGADIRRALSVQAIDPKAANQYWGRIDHAMVDHAVAVPLITHKTLDFVSGRVGNYQSTPYPYGVLLDQLWVK